MMNSMAFAAADAVVVDAFRYGNAWKNERWSICHPLPKYFNSTWTYASISTQTSNVSVRNGLYQISEAVAKIESKVEENNDKHKQINT